MTFSEINELIVNKTVEINRIKLDFILNILLKKNIFDLSNSPVLLFSMEHICEFKIKKKTFEIFQFKLFIFSILFHLLKVNLSANHALFNLKISLLFNFQGY